MEYNPRQSRSKGPLKEGCGMRESREGVKSPSCVILAAAEAEEVFVSSQNPRAIGYLRVEQQFSEKH